VAPPKVDPPELAESKPYAYEADIEIRPEISDIDYKGLSLKKNLYDVGEKEVEVQLKMIQKNLATQQAVTENRPVQKDDFVLITYEGFKDGEPFKETLKTENYTLKVGAGTILEDFDNQIVGMKAGETKEITVTFPEDYFNDKLAGLTITFKVELIQIREETLPEINDDMVKKIGQYKDLAELKDVISKNLEGGYKQRAEQEINEQIFQALLDKVTFEVPDAMIDMELEGIIQETEQSLGYQNMTIENLGLTRESLGERYRDTAEKQVRRHLILEKLIEQEKLALSDDEVDQGMEEMAKTVNQPKTEIKRFYDQNPDKMEFFKHTLLEKKVIGLIIENSTIENVIPERETADSTGA
jgi:trigger factor